MRKRNGGHKWVKLAPESPQHHRTHRKLENKMNSLKILQNTLEKTLQFHRFARKLLTFSFCWQQLQTVIGRKELDKWSMDNILFAKEIIHKVKSGIFTEIREGSASRHHGVTIEGVLKPSEHHSIVVMRASMYHQ